MNFDYLELPFAEKHLGAARYFAFTLIELLVTMAVIAVLAGLFLPVLSTAKRQAKSVHCRGNLRQIGLALRLYADDQEGRLPKITAFTGAQLKNVLTGLSSETFHCREDKRWFEKAGSSYDWNSVFNGRLLHRIGADNDPSGGSGQAMVYDHEPWHGCRNGVFPDGHAAPTQ
jgi:prepilin-type N-terminal cleavage/methylation domain-containing protein